MRRRWKGTRRCGASNGGTQGESYEAFVRRLAEASGIATPTRAELARFDRSRKNKKTSNEHTYPGRPCARPCGQVRPTVLHLRDLRVRRQDAGGARRDWGSQPRIGARARSAPLAGQEDGETPPRKRVAQKRQRGELVERPFARGHENIRKRVLIQAAGCNLGPLLRCLTGVGTPRSLQGRVLSVICRLIGDLIYSAGGV